MSPNKHETPLVCRYTYGKPVIGKVLLQADLDYSYSPWKYHGDEVMVETTFDVSCLPIKKKLYLLTKYIPLISAAVVQTHPREHS